MASRTLVVDNGASTIKCGYADGNTSYRIIPNNITRSKTERKAFIGDQLETCKDFSGLYYRLPFEKGLLTNWDVEKQVWDRIFTGKVMPCDPSSTTLLISEPILNLPNIATTYDQLVFEEYAFQSYTRMSAPQMAMYNEIPKLYGQKIGSGKKRVDCAVVVDSGYSFTHIVPFWKGKPILVGIRRINVGGKLLTNHLKEIISFRYWNMMDETHLVNEVKEACCFISNNFWEDLDICKKSPRANKILQHYVLPDYSSQQTGYIKGKRGTKKVKSKKTSSKMDIDIDQTEPEELGKDEEVENKESSGDEYDNDIEMTTPDDDEQVLTMNNERFTVPEILFHPSDIGMEQAGIPEAVVDAVSSCDEEIQGMLYANVVLIGGNARLPGFRRRVANDLRQLAPSEYEVRVGIDSDPLGYGWRGAVRLATMDEFASEFKSRLVTRAEYLESGSTLCESRFRSGV
ncbi:Actin- protein 6 [Lobosporangium transversale]|uniref:Actin-like protein ARP6 n=1 Tax=Lobosporangium transversale TaxID=64571 RepID=A0A1Y2GDY5_9FUNG|nr:actin-like protein ARP6 [Lobosporangium transversale]KAF9909337.1 Actin- protein 6 [Lobosporangium transversale]ORZ08074.1 actin-like protein ARP6 [Lobosporangium transversale]|eukprot:XP_021878308.1 actin-like protein ARP6 [Lobosporangium transversale]